MCSISAASCLKAPVQRQRLLLQIALQGQLHQLQSVFVKVSSKSSECKGFLSMKQHVYWLLLVVDWFVFSG
jgi:hypothetical protein